MIIIFYTLFILKMGEKERLGKNFRCLNHKIFIICKREEAKILFFLFPFLFIIWEDNGRGVYVK